LPDNTDDQTVAERRDALLLRLLKTPPQSRAELSEQVRRAKGKKATDSWQARQRRKARRRCLTVRGFVRLSVQEPLAFGPGQQGGCPFPIG